MDIKTEFNLDQVAWYMKNNKPVKVVISAINIFHVGTSQDSITYNAKDALNPVTWLDHSSIHESELFTSKEEVLNSL